MKKWLALLIKKKSKESIVSNL